MAFVAPFYFRNSTWSLSGIIYETISLGYLYIHDKFIPSVDVARKSIYVLYALAICVCEKRLKLPPPF